MKRNIEGMQEIRKRVIKIIFDIRGIIDINNIDCPCSSNNKINLKLLVILDTEYGMI